MEKSGKGVFLMISKVRNYLRVRFSMGRKGKERIISFWQKGGPDFNYFKAADDQQWIAIFWNTETVFYRLFSHLDLSRTLEIAAGAGRHSLQVINRIGELYLLDSSEGALNLARKKMEGRDHVHFIHHPSGTGLPASIPDASLTAVFSYDAMVHFEKETVASYISAAYRVLAPGGLCLFHYSNYSSNPTGDFSQNPGWRNYMTQEIFRSYVDDAGFELIETTIFEFSAPDSDAISLMRKPV
ncbi:MAG: class I SAM-dependent methyltransferase [Chitinophagaceae bacterium]